MIYKLHICNSLYLTKEIVEFNLFGLDSDVTYFFMLSNTSVSLRKLNFYDLFHLYHSTLRTEGSYYFLSFIIIISKSFVGILSFLLSICSLGKELLLLFGLIYFGLFFCLCYSFWFIFFSSFPFSSPLKL